MIKEIINSLIFYLILIQTGCFKGSIVLITFGIIKSGIIAATDEVIIQKIANVTKKG